MCAPAVLACGYLFPCTQQGCLMEFGAEETLVLLPGRFAALCGKQELTVRPTE